MHSRFLAPLLAVLFLAAGCSESKPDCKGTAQVCGGSCVELRSDNLNCGACGTACGGGQVCSQGACTVTCAAGLVNCGGNCIDPQTDRTFCGASGSCASPAAGASCSAGEVCSAGHCALSCQQGLTDCAGVCADNTSDNQNCGACGTACEAGQVCNGGHCQLSCQAGLVNCGGKCVDPATDRSFCGATGDCSGATGGVVCASGEVCTAGACVPSCPAGQVSCGGQCVDPMADRVHCGASGACTGPSVGAACAAGQVCSSGTCAVSCQAGLTDCAGICANTVSDNANCGACGTVCAAGQVCSGGQCRLSCQAGLVACGGKCVDPMADRAYCGASGDCSGANDGTVCAAGQVCSAGSCALSCQVGLTACAGECANTEADTRNCGACGNACQAGEVCSGGQCLLSCQAGQLNCGGKCIDPQTDRSFCGASSDCAGATGGTVCAAGQVCASGACVASCLAGQVLCGGKCVDPMTDRASCGASGACTGATAGVACAAGQVCSGGSCAVSCQAGLTDCGGTCASTVSDNRNCGACGVVCQAGQVCSAGQCRLNCQAGLVDCGGKCVDPNTDRAYCGASGSCLGATDGTVCAAGQVCSSGGCALSCQAGLVNCAGTCVDPQRDPHYCGADATCGTGQTCGSGFACDAGQCVLSCQAGLVNCGGRCVDPQTDRAYCGASGACTGGATGAVCAAGEVCSGGACTANCPSGQVACGGHCVDPLYDPDYCGAGPACAGGNGCFAGEACYQGICHALCAAGTVMCGGSCIDPLTNPSYCGASGYCAGPAAGTACLAGETCRAGACAPDCVTGAFDLTAQPPGSTLRGGAIGGQGVATVAGRTAWLQTSDWNQLWMPAGMRASDDVISVEADIYWPASAANGSGAFFALYSATSDHWNYGGLYMTSASAAKITWGATPSLGGAAVELRSSATTSITLDGWHRLRLEHEVASCTYRLLLDSNPVDSWTGPCEPTPSHYFFQSSGPGLQPTNFAWSNLRVDVGTTQACLPACPGGLVRCSGACIDPATDVTYCGASGTCAGAGAGATCTASERCETGACVPACSWLLAESHSLASAPAGSETRTSAASVSYMDIYGRTAAKIEGAWGLLRIPTGLTSATFAAEVDFYTPSTNAPGLGLTVFSDWGPAPVQRTRGLIFIPANNATPQLITEVYRPGDPCNGWGTLDCAQSTSGLWRRAVPMSPFTDAWHTLRVEGDRVTCRFRSYLDGVLLDTFSGTCDPSGTGFVLQGHGISVFSNLKAYVGTSACMP